MTNMFKDDVTKQWSLSRISCVIILFVNLLYSGYAVYKTGQMSDISNNWMYLVVFLYGLNKTSSTVTSMKIGNNEVKIDGPLTNNR